jgi:hypothetical protein
MAQQILNVSTPNSGLGDALRDASIKSNDNFTELYNGKVDKVTGKDLSDNNLTNALVTKINDLEALAQVNVQSDWNENDIDADAFIKNKPTQVFASLGYFDYNDLATQTTPISVPSNTQTLLTNDTLGANTDETQPPFGVTTVWNAGTANFFDFQQLSIGDTVDIRIHLKTTTSANNQLYHIDMKAGIGSPSEFENRIFSAYVKSSGIDEQTFITTFYVGNADIRDYPAQLFITSIGNTATVKVVGWFVRVFRKSVNIVDVVVAEEAPIDGLIYGRQDAEWVEVTGGGGSQTLAETLVLGNTTGGENIEISDGDGVFMDNGSRLIKGVTDAGTGGAKGIALKCSIDYEYKWEAGVLYVLQQDGFTIRETKYNFTNIPDEFDDITKGFIVGSRWILDNGDVYLCEDNLTGDAVWALVNTGITPTLQQVTNAGNTIASGNYETMVTSNLVEVVNVITNTGSSLTPDNGIAIKTGAYQSNIKTDDLTVNRVHQLPDSDGTLANDSEVVHNTGDETIAGIKTFSSLLNMPSTGVARVLQVESSGQISGLDLATFPSPNELINVKGTTSSIQTQLNGKLASNSWIDISLTSTIVGWSSFTLRDIQYLIIGNICHVRGIISGTSNSTTTSFTMPFNYTGASSFGLLGSSCIDVGAALPSGGLIRILSNTNNILLFRDGNLLNFTATGTKQVNFSFSFKIN